MAKGFGSSQKGDVGYVLLLIPEVKAYACQDPYGRGEDFIGITSSLEDARVWKKKKDAEAALHDYGSFLVDYLEQSDKKELAIRVCALKRLSNGKLKTDPEVEITFEKLSQP